MVLYRQTDRQPFFFFFSSLQYYSVKQTADPLPWHAVHHLVLLCKSAASWRASPNRTCSRCRTGLCAEATEQNNYTSNAVRLTAGVDGEDYNCFFLYLTQSNWQLKCLWASSWYQPIVSVAYLRLPVVCLIHNFYISFFSSVVNLVNYLKIKQITVLLYSIPVLQMLQRTPGFVTLCPWLRNSNN